MAQWAPRRPHGGILGPHPPRPVTGTISDSDPSPSFARDSVRDSSSRHTSFLKLEFPKFDGDNPRLWRDRCDMFFEVYSVGENLKTRFAALNFDGPAAT